MVKPALSPIFARFDRISHILIVAAPLRTFLAGPEGLGRKNFKIETQWIRTFIASVSEPY
jgi:hypothetical protein